MVAAIILSLLFGPLGLFYASVGGAIAMILFAIPFAITRTGGIWVPIASRILCAVLAVHALRQKDPASQVKNDCQRRLDEAARLEGKDPEKAIAAYEEIAKLFPETPASREAEHNIQLLKQARSLQNRTS